MDAKVLPRGNAMRGIKILSTSPTQHQINILKYTTHQQVTHGDIVEMNCGQVENLG